MKLNDKRINKKGDMPDKVGKSLLVIGDWMNNNKFPDMDANFTIHRGGMAITYAFEIKEVKRQPDVIEGQATPRKAQS